MRLIIAATGASGIILTKRLLEALKEHEKHLILSEAAKLVMAHEGITQEELRRVADYFYEAHQLDAAIASSSFEADGMVVAPCSTKSLAAIATGLEADLISRCAGNVLRTGKKLVVVVRETPLGLSTILNMLRLRLEGAVILPPTLAYYFGPKSVEDLTNFVVGKVLEALGLEHKLYKKWHELKGFPGEA